MIPFSITVLLRSNLGQASLFDDLSIAWSVLTQNTLDLGILDTEVWHQKSPFRGQSLIATTPSCLVGMASFCKLCKRPNEVYIALALFNVFISKKSIDRVRT